MKFVCDSCRSRYEIADEKVAGQTLNIRCRNCGYMIRLTAPAKGVAQAVPAPQSSETAAAWHYSVNGETFGPYSEDELIERFQDGRVGDEAYIWQSSFPEWKPAIEVPVFATAISVGRRSQQRQRAPKTMQLDAAELGNLIAATQPSETREPSPVRRATIAQAAITAQAAPEPEAFSREHEPLASGMRRIPSQLRSTVEASPIQQARAIAAARQTGEDLPLSPSATAQALRAQPATRTEPAPAAAPAEPVTANEASGAPDPARPLRRRSSVAMPVAFDELRDRIATGGRASTDTPIVPPATALRDGSAPVPPDPNEQTAPPANRPQTAPLRVRTPATSTSPGQPHTDKTPVEDLPTGELPAVTGPHVAAVPPATPETPEPGASLPVASPPPLAAKAPSAADDAMRFPSGSWQTATQEEEEPATGEFESAAYTTIGKSGLVNSDALPTGDFDAPANTSIGKSLFDADEGLDNDLLDEPTIETADEPELESEPTPRPAPAPAALQDSGPPPLGAAGEPATEPEPEPEVDPEPEAARVTAQPEPVPEPAAPALAEDSALVAPASEPAAATDPKESATSPGDDLDELLAAPAAPVVTRARTASASVGLVPPPKPMASRAPSGAQPSVPPSVPRPVAASIPAPQAKAAAPAPPAVRVDPEQATAELPRTPDVTPPAKPEVAEKSEAASLPESAAGTEPLAKAVPAEPATRPAPAPSTTAKPQSDDDALVDSWLGQGGGTQNVTSAPIAVPPVPPPSAEKKKSPLIWVGAFVGIAAVVGLAVALSGPSDTPATPDAGPAPVADTALQADAAAEEASAAAEASGQHSGPTPPTTAQQLALVRAQRATSAAIDAANTAAISSAGLPPEAIAELQRRQQVEQTNRRNNGSTPRTNGTEPAQNAAAEGTSRTNGSSFANMGNTQQVAVSGSQGAQRNDGPGREHFAAGLSGFVANSFRRCVQRHLVDEGSLPNAARVVVEITVQPDGDVSGIELDRAVQGTTFGNCMEGNSQNWRFPPFEGDAMTLQRTYIIE